MAASSTLENARQETVDKFRRIPGMGRSRAEAIYNAGYTNIGLLKKASVEELTRISGVGISLARCIKSNISSVNEDELPGTPPAPAADGKKQETGKLVVTETGVAPASSVPPASPKKPVDSAPETVPAPTDSGDKPDQQKGFLSSVLGWFLGKSEPAKEAPKMAGKLDEKTGEKKGAVTVEGKPEEKKDAPGDAVKVEGKPEETKVTPPDGIKIEGKPQEKKDTPVDAVRVEGTPDARPGGIPIEGKTGEPKKPEAGPAASGTDKKPGDGKALTEDINNILKEMSDKDTEMNK